MLAELIEQEAKILEDRLVFNMAAHLRTHATEVRKLEAEVVEQAERRRVEIGAYAKLLAEKRDRLAELEASEVARQSAKAFSASPSGYGLPSIFREGIGEDPAYGGTFPRPTAKETV